MTRFRWMARARRAARMGGLLLLVSGGAGLVTAHPSGARDDVNFTVGAEALSGLISIEFPDAGLVVGSEVLNAAPTRATTQRDSFGTSNAFAAAGYPGDIAFTVPATAVGILSGFEGVRDIVPLLPPVPAYPLAAQSDAVNPTVRTESGAFSVMASTEGGDSLAEALLGVDEQGVTGVSARSVAQSSFDEDTSSSLGEATAELSGLRIAGLLDISQRTTGTVTLGAGGQPTFDTESFFGVSLLGSEVQVGFGPEGLVAADNSLVDQAAVQTVLSALAATGIGLEYVPESTSEDGSTVVSAGLRISYTFTAPDEAAFLNQLGLPFNANVGRVITSVTLGQVTLRAQRGTLPAPSFGANDSGSVSAPPTSSPSGSGSSGSSGSGAHVRPATPPVTQAPAVPAAGGGAAEPASAIQPLELSVSTFYLALVVSGLAALGSSRLLGILAIRLRLAP